MMDSKVKQLNQLLIIILRFFVAHNYVIACREKLQFLAGNVGLDLLRRQVGECLYTIQSFYSNTNWVEMFGRTPYLDFGELVF